MLRGFLRRAAQLFRRNEFSEELREEIDLHVELRTRQLHERGAALRKFGNRAAVQDASRAEWGWSGWDRLLQDFRLAFRALAKSPKFTAFAVATLALGLGMNTAVFSVVDAVVLRGLPYAEPERLVSLWEEETPRAFQHSSTSGVSLGGSAHISVSVPNLLDYRHESHSFEAVAAFNLSPKNLTGIGNPERITGEAVTWNFFPVLRVAPVLGRGFQQEDDRDGAPPVVVLTYGFWQRRLGADPGVLSRSITLDGHPWQVAGVLPPDFRSPYQLTTRDAVEFYVPASYPARQLTDRGDHFVTAIGRLRRDTTVRRAQAELDGISYRLAKQYPGTDEGVTAKIGLLRQDLTHSVSGSLAALFGASCLIVLIACVNVANLFLVRAIARQHETSVRFALGAGRMRVIRQFLAESLIVAAAGCLAGIALAAGLLRALISMAPLNLPRIESVGIDWRVFAVAALVATLTGLASSLAPAWQASQASAGEALKAAARHTGGRRQARWRGMLTAAEIALSLMLMVGAGLLLKSFIMLNGIDLGFQPQRVLAMNLNLPAARYPDAAARLRFFQQLEPKVQALPGVVSVAFANRMPMRGAWRGGVNVDIAPDQPHLAGMQAVSPGYFETLGVRLLRGRLLTAGDHAGSPRVALVNQDFLRRFFPNTEGLGRQFRQNSGEWTLIAGVVRDVRRDGKATEITPQVYYPAAQTDAYPVQLADFAVRSEGDPKQLIRAIQAEVWAIDKDQPLTRVRTLEEIISASVAERRFQTLLLMLFAGVAVGLAMIGVFGVLSFNVSQRLSELGIRVALGAHPWSIIALVLRQATWLIAVGAGVGLAGAWTLSRFVAGMLFQARPNDWTIYAASVLALTAASFAAAIIPARRGSKVDPMAALRSE